MLYVCLGMGAGVSIVLNRMLNAQLGERIGVYRSTWVNYVTGLTLSLLILLIVREPFPTPPSVSGPGDLIMYTGGLLGVGVIVLSNIITPRLSAFFLTIVIFISQFSTGMALDYWMKGSLSPGQLVGALIMLAGLVLYSRGSKASQNPVDETNGTEK